MNKKNRFIVFTLLFLIVVPLLVQASDFEDIKKALVIVIPIVIGLIIIGVLCFLGWLFMLIDCIKRNFKTKFKWIFLIVLVPFAWIFYYFIIKKKDIKLQGTSKDPHPFALISLILSVVAVKFALYFGFFCGLPAIILAVVFKHKQEKNPKIVGEKLAKAGMILGIISIAIQIAFFVAYFGFFAVLIIQDFKDDDNVSESLLSLNDTEELFTENKLRDTLEESQTKTYTFMGVDYEVSINDITPKNRSANINVNGQVFTLQIKDVQVLVDGAGFSISDINSEDIPRFHINFVLGELIDIEGIDEFEVIY